MIRPYVADLHVHSVLSPCAAVEMTPRNIIRHAAAARIDIIAITDHNACDNIAAALDAAKEENVVVIPGMEVETKEEIHVIALFEKIWQLKEWEKVVQSRMSGRLNDEKRFGAQFVVDAWDNLIRVKPEMLLTSLNIGLAETAARIEELGGICIASHIDRPVYSVISQLGFIPPDVRFAAVELSPRFSGQDGYERFPGIRGLPVLCSSDAHTIETFISGPKTVFYVEQPSFSEIKLALGGLYSRKVVIRSQHHNICQ